MKEETDIYWPTKNRSKPKILKHRWSRLDGFRVAQCERCHTIRRWSDRYGKMVYEDRHHVFSLRSPNCSLPNTKI